MIHTLGKPLRYSIENQWLGQHWEHEDYCLTIGVVRVRDNG